MGTAASSRTGSRQNEDASSRAASREQDPVVVRPAAPELRPQPLVEGPAHYHDSISASSRASDQLDSTASSTVDGYSVRDSLITPTSDYNLPISGGTDSLSDSQKDCIRQCLTSLENSLDITFNLERVLANSQLMCYESGKRILTQGQGPGGIFIVDVGTVDVVSLNGGTVMNQLQHGEFFGELSTLFSKRCTASVVTKERVELLHLPAHCVRGNIEGELEERQLLDWCVHRSYIDTFGLFQPGDLSHAAISCFMKASEEFGDWSMESIDHIASLLVPMLFSDGETLYNTGEESCHIYFILRGSFELSSGGQEVSTVAVRSPQEGCCVGAREVVLGLPRECSVRAACVLLLVPVTRDTLLQTVIMYPSEIERLKELIEKSRTVQN